MIVTFGLRFELGTSTTRRWSAKLFECCAICLFLKIEVVLSFETSVNIYQLTRHNQSKDNITILLDRCLGIC